jgi:hypothetical protein
MTSSSDDDMPGLIPLKTSTARNESPTTLPKQKLSTRLFKKAQKIKKSVSICTVQETLAGVDDSKTTLQFRAYVPAASKTLAVDVVHSDQALGELQHLDHSAINSRFENQRLTKPFLEMFVNACIKMLEGEGGQHRQDEQQQEGGTGQSLASGGTEGSVSRPTPTPVDGSPPSTIENSNQHLRHADAQLEKERGNQRFQQGASKEALGHYTKAVELHPGNSHN